MKCEALVDEDVRQGLSNLSSMLSSRRLTIAANVTVAMGPTVPVLNIFFIIDIEFLQSKSVF